MEERKAASSWNLLDRSLLMIVVQAEKKRKDEEEYQEIKVNKDEISKIMSRSVVVTRPGGGADRLPGTSHVPRCVALS